MRHYDKAKQEARAKLAEVLWSTANGSSVVYNESAPEVRVVQVGTHQVDPGLESTWLSTG